MLRASGPAAIQRLLMLRQFPGFEDAELSELAMIAENVAERSFEPGEVVAAAGEVPPLHLIVEGMLESPTASWSEHEVFGALEAIAGRPAREPVIASTATRTLTLAGADFVEILEDNFGLLAIAWRSLARRRLGRAPHHFAGTGEPTVLGGEPLGMVDRVMVLREQLPFGRGRIEALAALAQAADEIRLPAGAELVRAGDRADGAIAILDGAVRGALPDGAAFVHTAGHAIGVLETLAEEPYASTLTAVTPVRALRFPGAALFDVLEDHTDLALAMVANLAGALLDLQPALSPIEVN